MPLSSQLTARGRASYPDSGAFGHALQIARAAGATAITIASDPNAVGFYERMGARRIGDVPSTPEGRTLPLLRIDVG